MQSYGLAQRVVVNASRYAVSQRRTFVAPTAARKADLIQELYIRELRNYKAPASKPSDAAGHVQKFKIPPPPRSPEETSLADDLKAYESQQVEVEGQSAEAGSGGAQEKEYDWFEEDPEWVEYYKNEAQGGSNAH